MQLQDVDFQLKAIAELHDAMAVAGKRDIILKSPTGSGKTIILTRFMQEYMHAVPKTAFVWLTPGKGELEEQSKNKMDCYCHNASTKNLSDVMTSGFAAGDAVFINWEKLTKKGSNALKDSERTNFLEWIEKARNEGVTFKIVVDESHQNFTEKADAIVELFKTNKIVRASATPKEDKAAILVEVKEEDVINAGLIKKLIQINPDFPSKVVLPKGDTDGTGYLLDRAWEKRTELAQALAKLGRPVNPLILVQLPNNSDEQLGEVERWFAKKHVDVVGGTFAVWLSARHDNLEGLTDNNGKQVAVVIKQAVATGWDCPRAQILVKLRHNMDETFEIQTIGRIRRMPEACHYEDDLLDSCYLYTLDEKFTSGVRESLGNKALNAKKVFIKSEHKPFSLVTEQRTMVKDESDPVIALNAVYAHFKKKYKLTADESKDRKKLETAGYDFRTDIWKHTQTGDATLMADMAKSKDFNDVAFNQKLDTHSHGRYFHHCVAEVGSRCGLKYEKCRKVVFRLFHDTGEKNMRIHSFGTQHLYAFVINNRQKLREDFSEAMSAELIQEGKGKPISEKPFHIPHEWIMTYDGESKTQQECVKNVYKGYLKSARPRSTGETKFERWCETEGKVDWWYRNGDKGDEFFSIVYEDNAGKQKLFYPDYILSIVGKTWIIEIKGGFNSSGQSENIDAYAEKKSVALKAYCGKHKLNGGFVCYDESDDVLLLSVDGFSEDVKADCWRLLDDAI